jgi:hypothetical protein
MDVLVETVDKQNKYDGVSSLKMKTTFPNLPLPTLA